MARKSPTPPIELQEDLPFSSVLSHAVFPNRATLTCQEVARVMGCTSRHIADLCAEGIIDGAVTISGANERGVNFWRIPVGAYDAWVTKSSNTERLRK